MSDVRTPEQQLWCVHILGPDDLYAAPSEAEARRAVAYMESHWNKIEPDAEVNRMVRFEAIPWPHAPESHAKDVGRFYSEIGLSPPETGPDEVWSRDEEYFNFSDLGELLDTYDDLEVGQVVYVGERVPQDPSAWFDADDLIEELSCRAYDACGECAEDWPDVTPEAKEEFNALVAAWIEKHCPVSFYSVTNVRSHTLTEEDLSER